MTGLLRELGLILDSRECCFVLPRREGGFLEERLPAMVQLRGGEIVAYGGRAYRLIGKSRDILCVFPGEVASPELLGSYLRRLVGRRLLWGNGLWVVIPTAASRQLQLNVSSVIVSALRIGNITLVPEIVAAALGAGFSLHPEAEDSHLGRMLVVLGGDRISAGVFIDGDIAGLAVRDQGWNDVIRAIQDSVQEKLLAPIGYTTFIKLVRSWGATFFAREFEDSGPTALSLRSADTVEDEEEEEDSQAPLSVDQQRRRSLPHIRSLNERGVLEYLFADPAIQSAIDHELHAILTQIKRVLHACFQALKFSQRGEIATDLFKHRILLTGDHYFDLDALARHLSMLTGFRFETLTGSPVGEGLKRMLAAPPGLRRHYRALCTQVCEREAVTFSRL
jgi:actin-like ATPase involved in cell morphogenesis